MNYVDTAVVIALITTAQTLLLALINKNQLRSRPPVGGRCHHCGHAHSDPPPS